MTQFHQRIFQLGWNHQLVYLGASFEIAFQIL